MRAERSNWPINPCQIDISAKFSLSISLNGKFPKHSALLSTTSIPCNLPCYRHLVDVCDKSPRKDNGQRLLNPKASYDLWSGGSQI